LAEGDSLAAIVREFQLDTESARRVEAEGLGAGAELYRVEGSTLIPQGAYTGETYIIDTPAGERIACHPHIVGEELKALCLEAAQVFVKAAEQVVPHLLGDAVIMHILRAGAGYMVAEAFPRRVPIVNVRTEYVEDGYRDHSDDPRGLRVSYRAVPDDLRRVGTLLVPDTYATGRSAEAALLDIILGGLVPERVVLYGFIAVPALVRLGALCKRHSIGLFSFALCDVTQLAHNNYDMAIYGLDESYHGVTGEARKLGSIIAPETLRRVAPSYVPGLDQPGDWSERQTRLFNGFEDEEGKIVGHLEKSAALIERLMAMSAGHPWYGEAQEEAARRELEALRLELARRR